MIPSPIGRTVVQTPKSKLIINGIVTIGVIPNALTAYKIKTVAIKNWKINLTVGVRPKDLWKTTFETSSIKPSKPAANIARAKAITSGDQMPMIVIVKTIAINITTPPIVGVPCFT